MLIIINNNFKKLIFDNIYGHIAESYFPSYWIPFAWDQMFTCSITPQSQLSLNKPNTFNIAMETETVQTC